MSESDSGELFNLVRERYGDRLTPQELEDVRSQVDRVIELADALRAVELDPRDEPLSLFQPYRVEG
jgi:hypothetical protein